ncbi:pyridoxamine 5'-phosphate oxidase family protein [Gordonia phthalatica]|uniref:Pyridoxamine 5'-phosphate oxidase n=1 Tax=Gordonia phthalatica TaxID=1136941 RepID=A0A0N9NA75_9ACTN|nr:pyridoxamine 5'-phosphate oxidase family protein [Gordonia phthalatica]ALG84242.1 pyridoxamine 5'-phosphate oxidase [Gordonia phthalatica]
MSNAPVEVLSEEKSWKLLNGSVFGRLAMCIDGQPEIFPLNVFANDGTILFHTADGTKLRELLANDRAVFETDAFTSKHGWSIVAKGRARVLSDPAEIADAERSPLHTWVPTVKTTYVRIDVDEITGRRFAFGLDSREE